MSPRTASENPTVSSSTATYSKVYLRIHSVECIKTTREIDKDEITLAAVKTVGVVTEKEGHKLARAKGEAGHRIDAGKFKKGTVNEFGEPKVIADFDYGSSSVPFPRHYPVSLVLVERDRGDVGKIVNAAIKAIEDDAIDLMTTAGTALLTGAASAILAGAAAGSVIPLVGTAGGAAAGALAEVGLGAIKKARADDVIDWNAAAGELDRAPSHAGRVGDRKALMFNGQGATYKVVYSWSVA